MCRSGNQRKDRGMRRTTEQSTRSMWQIGCSHCFVITAFLIAVGTCFNLRAAPASASDKSDIAREKARDWRVEAENRKRAFPLGHIPDGARARALAQIHEAAASAAQSTSFFITPKWSNIGPTP